MKVTKFSRLENYKVGKVEKLQGYSVFKITFKPSNFTIAPTTQLLDQF
jgi:hypothetical protein